MKEKRYKNKNNYDEYTNSDKNKENNSDTKSQENREDKRKELIELGQTYAQNRDDISIISIIGEIEGHDALGNSSKTTKYEHLLPRLAELEADDEVNGILILIHTMGGDVEAGLAIAEMIASISKPTVSLVLGGSHSIGVPIAVSTKYSFIVPTGTMVIHPVRMSGTVIGSRQTFAYMKQMQERINSFICNHSSISSKRLQEYITNTDILTKDVGSILTGKEAVEAGLINEMGGIDMAFRKIKKMIDVKNKKSKMNK